MSQIKFHHQTEDNITLEILAGWDYPLQYHFMVIFEMEKQEDGSLLDTKTIWTNLNYPKSRYHMNFYMNILKLFKINPPDGFRELCEKNERNAEYIWENNQWKQIK